MKRKGSLGWRVPKILLLFLILLAVVQPKGRVISPPGLLAGEGADIYLLAATFNPSRGETPDIPSALMLKEEELIGPSYYLVQFAGPIQEAWKEQLTALGAEILSYIPDYAFKVRMAPEQADRAVKLSPIAWIGPFHPAYKLSPYLEREGQNWYEVMLEKGVDLEGVQRQITAVGGSVLHIEEGLMLISLEGSLLDEVAKIRDVAWIDNYEEMRLYNDKAAGEMKAQPAWNAGWTGANQIICVADSGIDTGVDNPNVNDDMHRDLDNRFLQIRSWPVQPWLDPYVNNPRADDGASDQESGHGTHVTGSAAGNGARSTGLYKGIANGASLCFQAIEQYVDFNALGESQGGRDGYGLWGNPENLNDLLNEAYGWGARIHTNSWGSSAHPGAYLAKSRHADEFTWGHKDMIVLFAAGNDGADKNRNGLVDYGSLGVPATAKNIITVGACENLKPVPSPNPNSGTYGSWWPSDFPVAPLRDDPMANAGARGMVAFSSRGPTADGRIKPDVVAPGTWIASVRSSHASQRGWGTPINSYYMYMGGTSMATPLVAGAAAVVRDFYVRGRGHLYPSAALIKATLINSATDMPGQYAGPQNDAGPIPNNDEGWGAVNLEAAVDGGSRRFWDENYPLNTGQTQTFQQNITSSTKPLRITLVWTDYPGAVQAAVTLVNDLDLRVIAPDGTTYLGNVFSNGWSTAGGSPDRRNNVECVYVQNPPLGTYQIHVQAQNVPQGPQPFALVIGADLAGPPTPTPTHSSTPTRTLSPTRTPTLTPTGTPTATRAPLQVHEKSFQQGMGGYNGCVDTHINALSPDRNYGNERELAIEGTDQQAALVRFDVTSIPSEATVIEATLYLYMSAGPGNALPAGLYRMRRPWEEMQATWRQASQGTPWGVAGCNDIATDRYSPAVYTTTLHATNHWYMWGIQRMVQNWVRDPSGNQGVIIKAIGGPAGAACSFFSSEHGDSSKRPRLTVRYATGAGPAAAVFVRLPLLLRNWPPVPDRPELEDIVDPEGDGNYRVRWSAAARATEYELEEADNPYFVNAQVIYQGAGREKSVSGKALMSTWYYRVRARNQYGYGLYSPLKSITVLPPTPTPTRTDTATQTLTPTRTVTATRTPTLTRTPTSPPMATVEIVSHCNCDLRIELSGPTSTTVILPANGTQTIQIPAGTYNYVTTALPPCSGGKSGTIAFSAGSWRWTWSC